MTEQLFQIGIKSIVQNEDGDLLLLKGKDYWDIPGGRMDKGEDIETALLRELNEEIGINHIADKKLWRVVKSVKQIPYGDITTSLMLVVYHVRLGEYQTPRSCESGVSLHWVRSGLAADYLQNKYPNSFCQEIARLSGNKSID